MKIILTFIASQAKAMMVKCKLQYKVFKYNQHMISRLEDDVKADSTSHNYRSSSIRKRSNNVALQPHFLPPGFHIESVW